MGFVAPAVHYAALATNPPDHDLMGNHRSTKHSYHFLTSFSHLIRSFVHHSVESRSTNTDLSSESLRNGINLSGFVTKNEKTETLSNYNESRVSSKETKNFSETKNSSKSNLPASTEQSEKLPFSDLCRSSPLKNEKYPSNRFVYQKHYRSRSTFSPSLFEQSTSNILLTPQRTSSRYEKKAEKSHSTTTLPIVSTEENILDDSRRSRQITDIFRANSQPSTRLRRLQSKSKARPVSIEPMKNSPASDAFISNPISSSIAQRIEQLKNAMNRRNVEDFNSELDRRRFFNVKIDQQTQTLIKTKLHHVYHHHSHHLYHHISALKQFQWRLLLVLITTILIILYVVEIFTIVF